MSTQPTTTTGPICPQCGSTRTIPIIYGYPTYQTFQRAEQGELALGGCSISKDSPRWKCIECQECFGSRFREEVAH